MQTHAAFQTQAFRFTRQKGASVRGSHLVPSYLGHGQESSINRVPGAGRHCPQHDEVSRREPEKHRTGDVETSRLTHGLRAGDSVAGPVPERGKGQALGKAVGDGWKVPRSDDGAYYVTEQAGVAALATRQRTEEAARVLANALTEAGFPGLARLVVTEPVTEGRATVTLLPMRPDEARQLAALIDRAGRT
jgi:hypothetical protein